MLHDFGKRSPNDAVLLSHAYKRMTTYSYFDKDENKEKSMSSSGCDRVEKAQNI